METTLIYFLKANVLLTIFYFSYQLLVEKETFFNSNRWFLLLGLFTSVFLPLFFIEKIVWIEKPVASLVNASTQTLVSNSVSNPETTTFFNWYVLLYIGYFVIVFILFSQILLHLISLFKLLYNKEIQKEENFSLVDINENVTPFSFFRYIVFNSSLYNNTELQSILWHEKVHSREKHTFDLLIAKIFCALFWYNPIVWLYKKAIIQNLEYIADNKAIEHIEDKKVYQKALLKVVTNHNSLPITNNFYQSLIKKRIVMLNRNQSNQKNAWKYIVIIPVLVAFTMLYQVKIVAQEKNNPQFEQGIQSEVTEVIITKKSTDIELKDDEKRVKKYANVALKFSKIKRNKDGEITAIMTTFNDDEGTKGQHKVDGDTPIDDIVFSVKKYRNGKHEIGFFENNSEVSSTQELDNLNALDSLSPPVPPTPPITPNMSTMPLPPTPPTMPSPPNIKTPTDPNDRKAWQKYEDAMEKFSNEWENNPEMEKFEVAMKEYESKMEKWQPNMTAFEKEMEKFEAKMEAFQSKMESYQNNQEYNRNRENAKSDEINARRDIENSKRDQMNARRDLEAAKRDQIAAKRDIENAKRDIESTKQELQNTNLTPKEKGEMARETGRIARERGAKAREVGRLAREKNNKNKE